MNGFDIAKAYENGDLCGWAGHNRPDLVKAQFELLSQAGVFHSFAIIGQTQETAGKKMMLYQAARKGLGRDIPTYPQEIGDCTGFAMKHAQEMLQVTQKVLMGEAEQFRPVFPSYVYGASRVWVGRNQIQPSPDNPDGDGSLGAWVAQAAMKYGCLFEDEPGVPRYSGAVAKLWGFDQGRVLEKWQPTAKAFIVRSAALIRSWADFVKAICNGYPITTASNVGYEMMPRSDGFHHLGVKPWPHAMCFIGVDDDDNNPYAVLWNNWGDVHGHLKDFDTGEALPPGVLRVTRACVERHLAANESFAISDMVGFPEKKLDKALFNLI